MSPDTGSSTAYARHCDASGSDYRRPLRLVCGAIRVVDSPRHGPPRMTAEYAPELNIVGAVLGSPVGNPESVARRLNGSFFAGLAALMIAALIQVFPDAQQVVDRHATEEGKRLLEELPTLTTASAVWRLRNVDIGSYVDMSADELWDLPEVRNIFDNQAGTWRTPCPCWSSKPYTTTSSASGTSMSSSRHIDAAAPRSLITATGSAITYFCIHCQRP